MGEKTNSNAAIYLLERHIKGELADKAAFIEGDGDQRSISYRALNNQAAKMAAFYQKQDIRREERVALLLLDRIEFPVIFLGSLMAGVVPVALNTLLATEVYDTILKDSRATSLFVSSELFPAVEPIISQNDTLKTVFVVGGGCKEDLKCQSFDGALNDLPMSPMVDVKADESAFWLYSSGSTGQPKGVRHVHGSLQFTADTYGSQVLGIEPDDVVYSAAKFFFAYGLGNALTFPMSVGATTILLSGRPTPDSVVDILNTHNPTIFCGVPTLYAALVAHLESGKGQLQTRLRRCISAGEALPEEVGRNWERLSGAEILDGVGSTELLHIFLSNQSGDVVYGTSGVAVPGYDIRLVDETGMEVGVGEVGELLVDGESSATDYWNQREKSRNTFEGAWDKNR